MAKKRAWEAKDGTVFVERDDGGRDIIGPDRGSGKRLYGTEERSDEYSEDFDSEDFDSEDFDDSED